MLEGTRLSSAARRSMNLESLADVVNQKSSIHSFNDRNEKIGRKKKFRYSETLDIVEILKNYAKLGNKRKKNVFKTRKLNVARFKYKNRLNTVSQVRKTLTKSEKECKSELEKATIESLREMYFNTPQILKAIDEIKTEKLPTPIKVQDKSQGLNDIPFPSRSFQPYLNKFMGITKSSNMTKKSRDAIRKGLIVTVFNTDDDNLFTNKELRALEMMKDEIILFEKPNRIKKVTKDVWGWNELVNNLSKISAKRDSWSDVGHVSGKVPFSKHYLERRLIQYLDNWFQRESPTDVSDDTVNKFKFYENRYPRVYGLPTTKCRLDAAIKFTKLAKVVYPGLECMKILKELEKYIGPVTLDDLQEKTMETKTELITKPNIDFRYFEALLEETKELENIFSKNEKGIKEKVPKPEMSETNEDNLKMILGSKKLSKLYHEFVDSCLPSPFKEMFISITSGLLKSNFSDTPGAKPYQREITELYAHLLKSTLESMKSVVDAIFRCATGTAIDFSEGANLVEKADADEGQVPRSSQISEEELNKAIQKILVLIIKHRLMRFLFYSQDADISSSESISTITIDNVLS